MCVQFECQRLTCGVHLRQLASIWWLFSDFLVLTFFKYSSNSSCQRCTASIQYTHRPLTTHQIPFRSEKTFCRQTDGHLLDWLRGVSPTLHECQMKQMPRASLLENWRRPPGRPRTTWMKTIQQDLKSSNLSLNEAIDVAQNRPLWRLMCCLALRTPSDACQKKSQPLTVHCEGCCSYQ